MGYIYRIFLLQCVIFCTQNDFSNALKGEIEDAAENEFPFMVSIQYKGAGAMHNCGGTLISSRHVLTAQHCLEIEKNFRVTKKKSEKSSEKSEVITKRIPEKLDNLQVVVGSNTLTGGIKYDIESKITYEEWIGEDIDPSFNDYDVAIITLKEDVDLNNENIKVADISTLTNKDLTQVNLVQENRNKARLVGWGVSKKNKIPEHLKTGEVRILGINECSSRVRNYPTHEKEFMHRHQICTFSESYVRLQDADSGGPLLDKNDNVIGVNTGTFPKKSNRKDLINVHANINVYRKFIEDMINENKKKEHEVSANQKEASPGKRESSPGKRENFPAKRENSPGKRENSSGKNENSPGKRENSPRKRENFSGKRENSSGNRGNSPGRKENSSGKKQPISKKRPLPPSRKL